MPGVIDSYIHTANQVGALVELNCQSKITAMTEEFQTLAREIAMQIVACSEVRYVKIDDIPARIIIQIKRKYPSLEQYEALQQHLRTISLYDQLYIRDSSITIEDLIKLNISQLGENITVKRFSRFAIADDDSNPDSDPGSGVPTNPFPTSPTPLTNEAEMDVWNDVWDDEWRS